MMDRSRTSFRMLIAPPLFCGGLVVVLSACAQPSQPYYSANVRALPYLAVNSRQPAFYPEAVTRGSFVISNGCVAFRRAGDGFMLTPIFPKGSVLIPNSRGSFDLMVRNSRISLGSEVRIGGGEVILANYAEAAPESPVPANCPGKYWIVGSVSSA